MGLEQPKFHEEPDDEERRFRGGEPSNVIQGPWPRKEAGVETPGGKLEEAKVFEGPWKKTEPKPETAPEIDLPPGETVEEKEKKLEAIKNAQAAIDALYAEKAEQAEKAEKPAQNPDEESEKKRIPYTEVFEKYKRCEACNGKGRRFLIFLCKVCKGLGSVVESSSTTLGYHEIDRGAVSRENTQKETERK